SRLVDPTLEEMQHLVDERGPGNIRLHDPYWLAAFHINERKVKDYQSGRVFLAGDAAHIIFVAVSGHKKGHLVQETYANKIYSRDVDGRILSAIQITTALRSAAFSICWRLASCRRAGSSVRRTYR